MDSTPTTVTSTDHLLTLNSSPRKLPIKRRTTVHGEDIADLRRHPPFKFHRLWTEPDEIRFLQGLLDCSTESLSFPKDLNVFYTRFSNTISQHYSKSQLSEKLRRLRKKWRVVSTRITKGLDLSRLSPHDRALFELSEKLWHPDFSNTSPFGSACSATKVKVRFSPSISVSNQEIDDNNSCHVDCNNSDKYCDEDVKLSEVNVEFEEGKSSDDTGNEIGKIVAETVVDVFDESLKDVKLGKKFCYGVVSQSESFEKRWREQRKLELEVLAQRLRLVVEDSIQKQGQS